VKPFDNFSKYKNLREEYPFFIFEGYQIRYHKYNIRIEYKFNLAGKYYFKPSITIPEQPLLADKNFSPDDNLPGILHNFVFHIGMIELISYWKLACPKHVIIRPFVVSPEQIQWWKKLYFNGLGEFFFMNGVDITMEEFMQIECMSDQVTPTSKLNLSDEILVPVGGGKDSVVTLETLKESDTTIIPFALNPRTAISQSIQTAGFDNYFTFERTLDPLLLELNDKGFLNGHTPFSALLAFNTLLAAYLAGCKHIALSNESSANEATIPGTNINHQYSKSIEFENDFREYVAKYISPDLNYFSFLRPLSELQIASIFSRHKNHLPVFRSCNVGSKTNSWCGKCPKCLFTWIILSPFLQQYDLEKIMSSDLFSNESLIPILNELIGKSAEKPFECVGTIDEVNIALCETIRQYSKGKLPLLLDHYSNTEKYNQYAPMEFQEQMIGTDPNHNLESWLWQLLKSKI